MWWGSIQTLLERHRGAPALTRRDRAGDRAGDLGGDRARLPLSFQQETIWFLHQLWPTSHAYNLDFTRRYSGPLDVDRLRRSLLRVVERHEALRARFEFQGDHAVQIVERDAEIDWRFVDAAGAAAPDDEARRIAEEALRRPLDLARGPLVRATLVRLSPDEHLLSVVVHHIVFDGWSLQVLAEDLAESYATDRPLPPSPLSYADYAVWQRAWLRGDELEALEAEWAELLQDAPETTTLPSDRPRRPYDTFEGAVHSVELPATVTGRAEALARVEGVTLFTVLLAGFESLLARYCGADDLVIGTVLANRNRPELRDLVGCFARTLPLRVRLRDDIDFRTGLRLSHDALQETLRLQEAPFAGIVSAVGPRRDVATNPVFQTLVVWHDEPDRRARLPGLAERPVVLARNAVTSDLSLLVGRNGTGGLAVHLEYRTDLFSEETIETFADRYQRTISAVLDDPGRPLAELPPVTGAERLELDRAAAPARTRPPIHLGIREAIARSPDAAALVCGDQTLSYRALDGASGALARRLDAAAGRPFVPVIATGGPSVAVAFLGIMRAGRAFVPIDGRWPMARIRAVLEQLDVDVVVVDTAHPAVEGRTAITVEPDARDDGPWADAGPDDPIYAMSTSGTTGTPKLAVVHHGGIANRFAWMDDAFGIEAARATLQTTHHAFDSAVWQLFWPLVSGGTAHQLPDAGDVSVSATDLERLVERAGITILDFVPSWFRVLVPALVASSTAADSLRTVRRVILGGERIHGPSVRRFMRHFPGIRVSNLYGPTEASIGCIHHEVRPDEPDPIPIGLPITGTTAAVVDAAGRPVPDGIVGELCLGGACVGLGYVGDPPPAGRRVCRTGDLARRRGDGTFEVRGRTDDQLKIRGFRIEPEEVEAALIDAPGVAEGAVAPEDGPDGGSRLVGYVVPAPSADLDVTTIRHHLDGRLPAHMIPSRLVVCSELPRGPGGKIDRRRLRAPPVDAPTGDGEPPAARPLEVLIGQLFGELLGIPDVNPADDFFDHGGHSLLALTLIHRISEHVDRAVPVRLVFEAPTPRGLAQRIMSLDSSEEVAPLAADRDASTAPLSYAQERLWFLEQLFDRQPVYHLVVAAELTGPLDCAALDRAVAAVIGRQGALRTVIDGAEHPFQRRLDGPEHPLRIVDGPGDAQTLATMIGDEVRRPFDLATGPLFRATLFRESDERHVLVMTAHHLVADGASLELLVRDLCTSYSGGELAALPVQFTDFARWQREQLEMPSAQRHLQYWTDRLRGAPPLVELPADRPRPPMPSYRGDAVVRLIASELEREVVELGRTEGCTPFMTFFAAFVVLVNRLTAETDLVVGVPVTQRSHPLLEEVVGCFAETMVLRTDLSDAPTFRRVLRRVRQATLDAYGRLDVPFEQIVRALRPPRDVSFTPIFQVLFGYHDIPSAPLTLDGVTARPVAVDRGVARFDLELDLTVGADGLVARFGFATDLFDRDRIERLARHYETLLESIAGYPDSAIHELELLSPSESAALAAASGESIPPVRWTSVPDAIADSVARHPDRVALEAPDATLSYGELWERAGHVAGRLRALGVGRGDAVAVVAGRRSGTIAAFLGVLRAGGMYVPVEVTHAPERRVAGILDDARPRVVLVDDDGAARVSDRVEPVLAIDALGVPSAEPLPPTDPDDHAYLLYTSGTTGGPKGVVIRHGAVVNMATSLAARIGAPEGARWSAVHRFDFDLSVWEIYAPLVAGGRIVLASADDAARADRLAAFLSAHPIDVTSLTPSALRGVLATRPADASTSILVVGGEAFPADLAASAGRYAASVWNFYGPTEATVWTSAYRVDGEVPAGPFLPLGDPIPGTSLRVLGPDQEPVPAGVPGELCIGGCGVAAGYHERPELTRAKFVGEPRTYRTGDRAVQTRDGTLVFLGRLDTQVKLHGLRVELGEIEEAIASMRGVRTAVALLSDDAHEIVAFIVAEPGHAPRPEDVRTELADQLPRYMVPTRVVVVDQMPLTARGKVDRQALARELGGQTVADAGDRSVVRRVVDVWAELLDVESVEPQDDFFSIGGHSLLAVQMLARLRREGLEISLGDFFAEPTAAHVASVATPGPPPAAVTAAAHPSGAPLSAAQRGIWFLERLQPGESTYNLSMAFRLTGRLDEIALDAAVTELVRRHEALRAYVDGDRLVARPAEAAAIGVRVTAAGPVPAVWLAERTARPFELTAGPLFRCERLAVGDDESLLVLSFHHLVVDGWALGVIVDELSRIYAGEALPEPGFQPGRYGAWERTWLETEEAQEELAHVRSRLQDPPRPLALPNDDPRPSGPLSVGGTVPLSIPPSVFGALVAIGRQAGASPFMVLVAAFELWLAAETGQADHFVGSPVANRVLEGTEGAVGCFANTVVLRADLSGDASFRTVVERARDDTREALTHQRVPLDVVVRELRRTGAPFSVMFMLQNAPFRPLVLGDLEIEPVPIEHRTAKFDLSVSLTESDGGATGFLEYASDLFRRDTAVALAGRFSSVLGYVAADPDLRLSQVRERLGPLHEPADAGAIEAAMLEVEGVADAYVAPGSRVGFFVPLLPTQVDAVARALWDRLPARLRPASLHPVTAFTEDALVEQRTDAATFVARRTEPGRIAVRTQPSPAPVAAIPDGDRPPAYASGGPFPSRARVVTMTDALARAAEADGERLVFAASPDRAFGWADLWTDARRTGSALVGAGATPGVPVLLLVEDRWQRLRCFWGAVLAGAVPINVATEAKLRAILPVLDEPVVVGDRDAVATLRSGPPLLARLVGSDELDVDAPEVPVARVTADDTFFIQATSGSTGAPKLVPETHGRVIAHITSSAAVNGYDENEVSVNWIPLDHVVPMLTYHARDVYFAARHVQIPAEDVLAEPTVWLDVMERHGATHTWAPNFAFRLLANAVADVPDRSWDLSRLRRIMNAGEQVTPSVARDVMAALARFGVPANAHQPAFGMAEVATCMTYNNRFVAERAGDERFVDLGPPIPGVDIRIADEAGATLTEGATGRLQIRGDVVMPGYLGRPEADGETFDAEGWFDTGDLGFLSDGRLRITGRAKEMIVIRGVNHYCFEIEGLVWDVEGVVPTFVAACSRFDAATGTEALLIFFVPTSWRPADLDRVVHEIRTRVAAAIGVAPEVVVPVERERFPKTTSGKIQRAELLQEYEAAGTPDWFYERVWRTRERRPNRWTRRGGILIDHADAEAARAAEIERLLIREGWTPTDAIDEADALVEIGPRGAGDVLTWAQRIGQSCERRPRPFRWLVVATDAAGPTSPAEVGLLRAAAVELPGVRVTHLDARGQHCEATEIVEELHGPDGALEVRLRRGERQAPTLEKIDLGARPPATPPFVRDGLYLLTGGAGAVGRRLARVLVERYGVRLLIVGRRPPSEVVGIPPSARYLALDVGDAAALRGAVTSCDEPLCGVVHLAGVHRERLLADETTDGLDAVLHPKVEGARAIGELLEDHPDASFIGIGSIDSFRSGAGTGAYAAANHFLGAWVEEQRARGREARVIAFGAWAGVGMSRDATRAGLDEQTGSVRLREDEALESFLLAARLDATVIAVGFVAVAGYAVPDPSERRDGGRDQSAAHGRAPETPAERQVAEMFEDLLGVPVASVEDDFFGLGGHSLAAARLATRLADAAGRRVPFRTIFERPSVLELSRELRHGTTAADGPVPLVARTTPGELVPVSLEQELLLELEAAVPTVALFNLFAGFRVLGPLDLESLERALQRLVSRQWSLRTVFVDEPGAPPQQRVGPSRPVELDVLDLSDASPDIQARTVAYWQRLESALPFRPTVEPPFRVALARLSPDEHVLSVIVHHSIGDGRSIDIFVRELAALYSGGSDRLTPLPIQYTDFSRWQCASRARGAYSARIEQIVDRLDGVPVTQGGTVATAVEERHLSQAVTERLSDLAARAGTTLFVVVLAAFDIAWGGRRGREPAQIATSVTTRQDPVFESLIGCFTNTVVMRVGHAGAEDFTEVVRRAQAAQIQGLEDAEVPIELVAREFEVRHGSRAGMFDAMLWWQSAPVGAVSAGDVRFESSPTPVDLVQRGQMLVPGDILLDLLETPGDGVLVRAIYKPAGIASDEVASLLDRLIHIADRVTTDPTVKVGSL